MYVCGIICSSTVRRIVKSRGIALIMYVLLYVVLRLCDKSQSREELRAVSILTATRRLVVSSQKLIKACNTKTWTYAGVDDLTYSFYFFFLQKEQTEPYAKRDCSTRRVYL